MQATLHVYVRTINRSPFTLNRADQPGSNDVHIPKQPGVPCSPGAQLSDSRERCILVAVTIKRAHHLNALDSVRELGQLAATAGCQVVGCLTQGLPAPHPRTYVGDGKLAELAQLVEATGAETVFFDDELSPSQLRNVGRRLGPDVRVADRTSLILDIFRQRAATREGKLQVALAETQYQLPRLTRLWTHLERQAGGGAQVRGMGETQREVDQRLLRARAAQLAIEIEQVQQEGGE